MRCVRLEKKQYYFDAIRFFFQEVPKGSEYITGKIIYLFSINLPQISRMLIEKSYRVSVPAVHRTINFKCWCGTHGDLC